MMPAGAFESSCTYLRFGSLILGFILFLVGILILLRPLAKKRQYSDEDRRTRAVDLYLKTQEEQKGHLVWMIVIFALIVWYTGAIISSSYVSDYLVDKGAGCPQDSPEAKAYAGYNLSILYPPLLFALGILLAVAGTITRGGLSKAAHALSYILVILGAILTVTLFLNVDICSVSARCT